MLSVCLQLCRIVAECVLYKTVPKTGCHFKFDLYVLSSLSPLWSGCGGTGGIVLPQCFLPIFPGTRVGPADRTLRERGPPAWPQVMLGWARCPAPAPGGVRGSSRPRLPRTSRPWQGAVAAAAPSPPPVLRAHTAGSSRSLGRLIPRCRTWFGSGGPAAAERDRAGPGRAGSPGEPRQSRCPPRPSAPRRCGRTG